MAVQTAVLHLLGDAAAPTLIGLVSDLLSGGDRSDYHHYMDLRDALFVPMLALALGGAAFLAASFTVVKDRRRAIAGLPALLPRRSRTTVTFHGSRFQIPWRLQWLPSHRIKF